MTTIRQLPAALALISVLASCGGSAQSCSSKVIAQDAQANKQRPYPLNAQAEKALDQINIGQQCQDATT